MIGVPGSLAGRLRLAAILSITGVLIVAAVAMTAIVERIIIGQIDQRLDSRIAELLTAVEGSGTRLPVLSPALAMPPFDRPGSGWTWQVDGTWGTLTSPSLGDHILTAPGTARPRAGKAARTRPADAPGPDGQKLHWRIRDGESGGNRISVLATAPYTAIYRELRQALLPLFIALAVLGGLLFTAALVQVRLGLRPLRSLSDGLAQIRQGRAKELPETQPDEIRPLVGELNSLLRENNEGLARARRHTSNLSHGLKTPLAAMHLMLERGGGDLDLAAMKGQVGLMDRLIRHHLTRARSAALAGPVRARTVIAERLNDLAGTIALIHRDRGIRFDVDVPEDLAVAVESEDFDEIIGNLMDNAGKWARAVVIVRAASEGKQILIDIRDDGPGIAADDMPEALRPGHRIDEARPGYGFGLPIAIELAELYGGSLTLSATQSPGLGVRVALPGAGTP